MCMRRGVRANAFPSRRSRSRLLLLGSRFSRPTVKVLRYRLQPTARLCYPAHRQHAAGRPRVGMKLAPILIAGLALLIGACGTDLGSVASGDDYTASVKQAD